MNQLTRRQFLGAGAAGLWATGYALADNAANDGIFTFAAINDTHVKDEASVEIVERAAAQINADSRIRFVTVLGDIGTDGTRTEMTLARDGLANIERPCFAVPGNHDVAMGEEDIYANYKDAFGPVHWVHEQYDWTFIGFDSCEENKSYVTVADAELAWLERQIAAIDPDRPIALFCHHPLNPNTRNYRILNADDILALFKGHALRIAAAGHWHGNQLETENNILFVTTACCATTRGNFDNTEERGYRLFHLKGETVHTEFVEVAV